MCAATDVDHADVDAQCEPVGYAAVDLAQVCLADKCVLPHDPDWCGVQLFLRHQDMECEAVPVVNPELAPADSQVLSVGTLELTVQCVDALQAVLHKKS